MVQALEASVVETLECFLKRSIRQEQEMMSNYYISEFVLLKDLMEVLEASQVQPLLLENMQEENETSGIEALMSFQMQSLEEESASTLDCFWIPCHFRRTPKN